MNFILAVSDDNKIALGGKIPWRNSHDLRWFKMNTYGRTIIMGRKTWDSIGRKSLRFRRNIVVSRRKVSGVETIINLNDIRLKHSNAWVIGGSELCQQVWKSGDILVLTRIHTTVGESGLRIKLPPMRRLWQKSFNSHTFSINIIQ